MQAAVQSNDAPRVPQGPSAWQSARQPAERLSADQGCPSVRPRGVWQAGQPAPCIHHMYCTYRTYRTAHGAVASWYWTGVA
eukprot:272137-Chlamydomonas_euryale.AAC.1